MQTNVGILGLGLFLPPTIRTNAWWSPAVVDRWMAARRAAPPPPAPATEGEARVLAALATQAIDPFQGTVERRVMPDDMSILDMEERAAREAIARAGIAPAEIDLVLTHTVVPDYWLGNPACQLHERLGLPTQSFALHLDAAAYSSIMQLELAELMIASGRARHGLLVQASAPSRLVDHEDPGAPIVGDGATAMVVGPVAGGRGVLAAAHFTDGRFPRTLVATVPGKRWFDDGRATIHVEDPRQMRAVFMQTADLCKRGVEAALAKLQLTARDVDFFALHQGTPWLREVVQAHAGLEHARHVDVFHRIGYLSSALVPAQLYIALEEGALHEDDLVVLTGGGTGMTYGAMALRWGR